MDVCVCLCVWCVFNGFEDRDSILLEIAGFHWRNGLRQRYAHATKQIYIIYTICDVVYSIKNPSCIYGKPIYIEYATEPLVHTISWKCWPVIRSIWYFWHLVDKMTFHANNTLVWQNGSRNRSRCHGQSIAMIIKSLWAIGRMLGAHHLRGHQSTLPKW